MIAAALAAVRNTEGRAPMGNCDRATIRLVRRGHDGGAARLCTLSIIKNRPVPQDRIWVAIMHSDLVDRGSQASRGHDAFAERGSDSRVHVYNYVDYRVSYNWETVQNNYDRTRYVTVGAEQKKLHR